MTLGSRFRRLGERLQAGVAETFRDGGIGVQPAQIPVIHALGEGPSTVGALGQRLDLSQPGITRSLGKLATDGFIEVVPGRADQRQREARLTDKGRALLTRLSAEFYADVEAAVAAICEAPAENLLAYLDRLDAALAEIPLESRIRTERTKRTAR
ncbi:MarR family winged helix-turn-helix transcriptional regulator [Novosphingobium sp. 9]|uniref:MarR family winged helix-turn-helix transcriptional regulator n=1 Tax=Novosphingobium sp. 9 TaxID=2025349 RepID=UPI0021B57E65|nr:MarR family transcriptional regulator [Novosphingobium sp. 9]